MKTFDDLYAELTEKVATRCPEISSTDAHSPGRAAYRKVEAPKPSGMTSIAALPESRSRSRPAIPQSTVPEPT